MMGRYSGYILLLFCFFVQACSSSRQTAAKKEIDLGQFSIEVPSSWEMVILRGIDSYVGKLKMEDGDEVSFDLGMYSNTLSGEKNSIETWKTIDGYEAKIVRPSNSGDGLTGIYIDSLWGKGLNRTRFNLYGRNLSKRNQSEFLEAVTTIKFGK